MPNYAALQKRFAAMIGRPLLMTPSGAEQLAQLILQAEPTAFNSPMRLDAWRRARASRPQPAAFDDDDVAAQSVAPLPPGGLAYAPMWLGEPDDELDWGMALKDGIATLCIDTAIDAKGEDWCGTWYHGYDSLHAAVSTAMEDPRVEGLFIHMESPGGVVVDGIFKLTELMRETRAANGGKPIHVHGELIASAAYWIGSQADRITASRTAAVGSIGAVMLHHDYSGAMEKAGVRVTPIQGGERKTEFASFQGLDEEAKINLQAMIDQVYRDFVSEVVAGRPMLDAGTLYGTEARLFDARNDLEDHSGLALGLIDTIESEETAFEHLRNQISRNTPAAGSTPTIGSQSREHKKETAMSVYMKALAALSADGKAADRIAAAIGILPKGSSARGILLGSGAVETRISRAKVKIAEELDDENAEDDPDAMEDPDANEDDPDANEDDPDANEDDPDANEDDPDATEDPDANEDDPDANEDDPDAEDEPKDPMARAEAILALPEAKGRTALAQKLAFSKGMKVNTAKGLLAAAPKGKRRAVTDPKLSGNAGGGAKATSADERLVRSSLKIRDRRSA